MSRADLYDALLNIDDGCVSVCPGQRDSPAKQKSRDKPQHEDIDSLQDMSSPNPDQFAPLLEQEQRPPPDRDTADEGLPPSKDSDIESMDEKSEQEEKEKPPPDPNNNEKNEGEDGGGLSPEALSPVQDPQAEETYCSDEIAVVLVDNSGASVRLDESDTVKIIITMSCDAQTAAELEQSVKQSILESAHSQMAKDNHGESRGDCMIRIPVITFDSPLEEEHEATVEGEEEEEEEEYKPAVEDEPQMPNPKLSHSKEPISSDLVTQNYREYEPEEQEVEHGSLPLTNDNSSSGIDVHSHHDENEAPELRMDADGFLQIPPGYGRYGPGGRTHVRGLSIDSGRDAVLIADKSKGKTHTMTTSKSDLEAKEGQMPNESNFVEFVSLLESINCTRGASGTQPEEAEDAEEKEDDEGEELLIDLYTQNVCNL